MSRGPVLEQRIAAAERFAATELPTSEEEIWRYSRIGELDLDRFGPAAVATVVTGAEGVGTHLAPGGLELFPGDAPDAFAELNAAFMSPVVLTHPAGASSSTARSPSPTRWPTGGRRVPTAR